MTPRHGPEVIEGGVRFWVWAPGAKGLQVRVDGRDVPMQQRDDGWCHADVPGARAGSRYAFVFEDGRVRPDPATRRQPESVHAASQVFDPSTFHWTDGAWRSPRLEELIIYELHLGTFTQEGTFDAAAKRLPQLVDLGITCVELMPVQPFPGDRNWGYDGVAPFGVQESYGGPEGLMRFVDRAHALGLSVCLDVVYNHMGPEGNYLRDFGPYFTSRHKSPWGDGINFDGRDSGPVRQFAIQAATQWIRDFHVDALRLDAVHAIPDDSRPHVLRELSDAVHAEAKKLGRTAFLIAESDLNDRKVVESTGEGWGMDAAWADDLHHALHALLTGENASFFQDYGKIEQVATALAEGFVYQGQTSKFRGHAHGTTTRGLRPSAFVTCSQNHDQVGNRPNGERLTALVPFEALEAVAAAVILGPGLPMLFMGEEYGETRPFLYFTSHTDPELAKAVSEGRKKEFIAGGGQGEAPDPQAQSTLDASRLTHRRDGKHGQLYRTYQELLRLRRKHLETLSQWPKVEVSGRLITMRRPALSVRVNLGPTPASGLKAWGWQVSN